MTDIRLTQNTLFPRYSVTVDASIRDNGMIDDRYALATAVIVALGTDALAERDDILPDPDSTDRAGWWGDLDAEEIWDGWPIGSRLWLLKRDKIEDPGSRRGATVTRVDRYIREALQPFLDRRIASTLSVDVQRVGRERIDAHVIMYRGPTLAVDLRYQIAWAGLLEYEDEAN
jgi:phage gp46-like protein